MTKSQTAVEWLINYMEANFHLTDESRDVFEQAKAMKREQIIDAFDEGYYDCEDWAFDNGEQYYNKTFGNE